MNDGPTEPGPTEDLDVTRTVEASRHSGEVIGRYRILQKLGEGGMGEVYEAEQQAPIRRKVALKLIKVGMDTKHVIARFESERQALALMNHPNIARVLDAGETARGRPYFAMEYVKGVSITSYCDTHRLGMNERIELFIKVCEGVQHAHHKGIIHRDIKPSNVLVKIQDDVPVPKIIDFGVAKATAQRLTENTMHTELGALVGTPEYMSPEQAEMSGLDIDTRTDVYSLGVLLYELLVGAMPFDSSQLRQAGFDEIRRKIREDEPPRPSTRISTMSHGSSSSAKLRRTDWTTLARELRGDLDWITMKALEKDRTRRYETPLALAADLARHVHDEPVLARPPSTTYRVGKFVRRHRLGVVAATLIVAALVGGATLSLIGFVKARRAQGLAVLEADRASREAETSAQISSFLVGMFNVADPSEALGNSITARQILDTGARRIREELSTEPVVRARLMETMGNVYRSLGLYDESRSLLEETLAIREQELGPDHPDVASTLNDLGYLLWIKGEYGGARSMHERALSIRERALGADHPEVALSLHNLANVVADDGDYEGSRPLYRRALEIRERTVSEATARVAASAPGASAATVGKLEIDVASTLNNLASVLHYLCEHDEARSLYERALAIDEKLLDPDHMDIAIDLDNLGTLLQSSADYESARPLQERAIQIREKVLGPDHPHVANSLINLGALYLEAGQVERSRELNRRALEIYEKALGPEHQDVALALNNLGIVAHVAGDNDRARRLFDRALAMRRKTLGADHPAVGGTLRELADLDAAEGNYLLARSGYARAISLLEAGLGTEHRDVAITLRRQGKLDAARGDYPAARAKYERALSILEKCPGADHPQYAETLRKIGMLDVAEGDHAAAEADYERALSIFDSVPGLHYRELREFLEEYAAVLRKTGEAAEAGRIELRARELGR